MPYTAWTGRRFGIEMEITERNMTDQRLKQALAAVLPVGRLNPTRAGYFHSTGSTWDVKLDSSAGTARGEYGFEIATPALVMDETGNNAELKAGTNAIAALRPYITHADGVHVHIDVSDFDWNDLRKLMILWVRYEPFFFSLVPASRRTNQYCYPSRKAEWGGRDAHQWPNTQSAVDSTGRRNFERYARQNGRGALNLAHFWRNGRVEIRLHSGTVDYEKLRHWVILLLSLANRVKQTQMPRIERGRYIEKPLPTAYIAKVLGLAPTKYVPEVNPAAAGIVAFLERRRQQFAGQAEDSAGRSVRPGFPVSHPFVTADDRAARAQADDRAARAQPDF